MLVKGRPANRHPFRLFFAVIGVGLFALPPAVKGQDGAARASSASTSDYAVIKSAINSGHFLEAKGILIARLQTSPADGYAHLLLGIVLSELNEGENAEFQFREASRLRPLDSAPHTDLGNLLASRGRLEEAKKQFEEALALNPRDAASLSNLGSVQMSLKQYRPAMKCFDAASRVAPGDVRALLGLFQSQLKLGLSTPSQETANRLLNLPGLDEQAVEILGATQGESGDYVGAVRTFAKGARLFPQSQTIQFNLGLALEKSGNPGRAATVLEALRSKQDTPELENVLGGVYEHAGQFLAAVKSYQRAAEEEATNEGYRFDYVSELLAHRNFEAARLVAERAVYDFPESVRISVALGMALFGLSRFQEAQSLFLQTARRFPDAELPLISLILCAEVSEIALPESTELLNAFYRNHPTQFMAPYLLGRTALKNGDPASAATLLQVSIKLRSDYAPSHFELGRAQADLGQMNEAIDQYLAALKLDGDKTEIWYRLTLAYRKLGQSKLADKAEEEFRKVGAKTGKPDLVQTFLYSTSK
ncbi:MAG: tetratricopeptide repeat protein [Bryobacteraceae bacterium]